MSTKLTREDMDQTMHRLAKLTQPLQTRPDYRAGVTVTADDEESSDEKSAKFTKGKPADPTKNMSPEQKAEWQKQKDTHKDKFKKSKSAAEYDEAFARLSILAGDDEEEDDDGDEKEGRFEEGKPADPTKNMTPEEAAEWKANTEKNRDKFKKKAFDKFQAALNKLAAGSIQDVLGQLLDMAVESMGGGDEAYVTDEMSRAANQWDDKVQSELTKWAKANMDKFELSARPFSRIRRADESSITDVLMVHRGGAPYLYYMEAEGHGVGTWDGDWDQLFKEGSRTVDELSEYIKRATSREYQALSEVIQDVAAASAPEEEDDWGRGASAKKAACDCGAGTCDDCSKAHHVAQLDDMWGKTAARTGLYGFTKKTQNDCETSIRKLARQATKLAKAAYKKDENVAPFLAMHAKRGKSTAAKVLVAAMKNLGPKVAAQMEKTAGRKVPSGLTSDQEELWGSLRLIAENDGTAYRKGDAGGAVRSAWREFSASLASDLHSDYKKIRMALIFDLKQDWEQTKAASKTAGYSLYGFRSKTATLGSNACASLRVEAGRVASDLHRRRMDKHANITGFFDSHCKKGRCMEARMLRDVYPDADMRLASAPEPSDVDGWLVWEE